MKIKTNQVILLGRVGSYKDIKCLENGTIITTINIGVKRGQDKWNNFFVKFFNTKTKNTADEVAELVNEGDYIQITGRLIESNFIPKGWENQLDENGRQRTVSKIEVVGNSYKKVYFNKESEEFEYLDGDSNG